MKGNPYVGPRPIGGEDHKDEKIYGRDREIADLVDLLIADRIVLLHSPSGAGKSSLLQAGLTPAMEKRRFKVRPILRVNAVPPPEVHFDPATGNRYALSCMLSLEEQMPAEKKWSLDQLAHMTVSQYLGAEPNGEVLIFDQFEEVLTVDPVDQDEKKEFFTQLGEALAEPGRWAVFAIREDYLAALDPYINLVPTRFSNTFRLDLLKSDGEGAIDAIRLPAKFAETSVDFTREAARALVANLSEIRVQYPDGTSKVTAGLYVEPVQLQVVCRRIWQDLPESVTSIPSIDPARLGSVNTALSAYYQDSVEAAVKAGGVSERAIRTWFDRCLITKRNTRSQISQSDDGTTPILPALKALVDSYLIRCDRRLGSMWYELAHDRLVTPVQANNAAWYKANLSELEKRAERWAQKGKPDSLLAMDAESGSLEKWKLELPPGDSLEREFVEKSEAPRTARRKLYVLGAFLTAVAIVAGIYIVLYIKNVHRTRSLGQIALSNTLADMGLSKRTGRLDVAALLSVEAWNRGHTVQARNALLTAYVTNRNLKTLLHHRSQVTSAVFGPQGNLAVACTDGTIWLWDVKASPPVARVIAAHKGAVLSVAFNEQGLLASGGADGAVHLWDTSIGGTLPAPAKPPHKGRVNSVSFDAAGEALATGGEDGVIRLWHASHAGLVQFAAKEAIPSEVRAGAEIKSVALSLASHQLAAALINGGFVWDLNNPGDPRTIVPEDAEMVAFTMSAQGWADPAVPNLVAVQGNDAALVWTKGNLEAAPQKFGNMKGERWRFVAALRSHWDEIAVSGEDRTIKLWTVPPGAAPAIELQGPETSIHVLTFSPSGLMLASAGENDHSVWLWDLVNYEGRSVASRLSGPLNIAGGEFESVVADPQGKWLAATDGAHGENLVSFARSKGKWILQAKRPIRTVSVAGWRKDWRPPLAASPAADRPFLAVAEANGAITIRNPATLEVTASFNDRSSDPQASSRLPAGLAVNRTGKILAVTGWQGNGGIRIYSLEDLAHPARIAELPGPLSPLEAIAFSPRRDLLAVGGNSMMAQKVDPENNEIRLWDLSDPRRPKLFTSLRGAESRRLVFSPDGRIIASASNDTVIRLFDVPERPPQGVEASPRAVLRGHTGWVRNLRFSPDGTILASGGSASDDKLDTSIRLWDPERGIGFGEPINYPWPVDVGEFDPVSSTLIFAPMEGEIWGVDLDPAIWVKDLCSRANRNFSLEEWERYLNKDEKYRKTCPALPLGDGAK